MQHHISIQRYATLVTKPTLVSKRVAPLKFEACDYDYILNGKKVIHWSILS